MAAETSSSDQDRPDAQSPEVCDMALRWDLLHDLWGGTLVMRQQGTKWLPKETAEQDDKYAVRLGRSILHDGFADTVRKLASKPFARPVTLRGESLPEWLTELEANVNRAGRNLTQFAHTAFSDGLFYGHGVILGEAPVSDGEQPSEGERRERNLNPYLIEVPANRILGWTEAETDTGQVAVVGIRIREDAYQDGEAVIRVRDIQKPLEGPGKVVLHEKVGEREWTEEESPYTLEGPEGGVPVFPFYSQYEGTLTSRPPLEGLGWLNLAHWQSFSDQRNILRFARAGLLAAFGIQEKELKNIVLGPNGLFHTATGPQDADLKYVEHSGKSIEAGRQDVLDLEDKMERLGMQMLMKEQGSQTATGQALNAEGNRSQLQSAVLSLAGALTAGINWVGTTRNEPLPEEFAVSIFDEFDVPFFGSDRRDVLLKSTAQGLLPKRYFLEELKRDGTLSSTADVAAILEELEREEAERMERDAALLATVPGEPDDDPSDE